MAEGLRGGRRFSGSRPGETQELERVGVWDWGQGTERSGERASRARINVKAVLEESWESRKWPGRVRAGWAGKTEVRKVW